MPVLTTRNAAPTVASDVVNLPPEVPDIPDDVVKRFPSLSGWQDEMDNFWTRAKQAINDSAQSVSNRVNSGTTNSGNVRVIAANLEAQILAEKVARISADAALAASISTVSAAVGTKARITVSSIPPGSPSINDLWLDTGDNNKYKFWDGVVWQYKQDLVLAAAVSTESTARVTADGFLEGKYTLTVVAGNVVTGMNITSSTGGGTNISSVIFRATDFKIYNSVTGVAMFTVSGTAIKLGATLTVDTANSKVYIGAGNYGVTDTAFYVDSAGKFSLKDQLTWDGTTLSISGGAVTTVSWTTQVTSRPTELIDGRIPIALSAAGLVVSGVIPGINVTTGAAGLYLGADFLGYYNGAAWRTYMDNAGNFYLGGTSGSLQWNGTTLTISGNITVTGGNAAKTDFSNVTAHYAGSPGVAGAANTIVSQGALATQNSASWTSQVSSRPTELTDGRIPIALNSAGLVISGVTPGINVTTGSAGLYLGADFLGYYNGSAWKTYMDNSGNFYLGGTSGALQWNGTSLTITGVINVTSITGVNYAGAASPGAAATSIVGQGALATQNNVAYATQVTGAPINASTGALNLGTSPSGSGLFLGSDHLGYYASGAWKTYMDSSGNFYLGGTSGSLQWNGTTLTIDGTGTFSGALNAASGTFTGNLSAAGGTFSGTVDIGSGTSRAHLDSSKFTYGYGQNERMEVFYDTTGGVASEVLEIYAGGNLVTKLGAFNAGSQQGSLELYAFNGGLGSNYITAWPGTGIRVQQNSGNSILQGRVVSDTTPRVLIRCEGTLEWGPGNASLDTNLYRSASGRLRTDGDFDIGGFLKMGGVTVFSGTDLISSGIQLAFSNPVKCNLVVDEPGGSDMAFTEYLSWFQNGRQCWVPFTSSAP